MALAALLTIDISLPGGMIDGHHDLTTARTAGFTTLTSHQYELLSSRSTIVSPLVALACPSTVATNVCKA